MKPNRAYILIGGIILLLAVSLLIVVELRAERTPDRALSGPTTTRDEASSSIGPSPGGAYTFDSFIVRASGYTPAFTLHAFDSKKRHTGPVPIPSPPPNEFTGIEEKIAGASYSTAGYNIYLSFSNSEDQYQIEVQGQRRGNFKLEVQLFDSNSHNIATLEYAGGMVNPHYHAYLTIPPHGFATPPELVIDSDGNGKPDGRQTATLLSPAQ